MIRDSFAIPAGINSESSENHCGISFRHLRNYCRTEHPQDYSRGLFRNFKCFVLLRSIRDFHICRP